MHRRRHHSLAGFLLFALLGGIALAFAVTFWVGREDFGRDRARSFLRADVTRIATLIRLLDDLPNQARTAAEQALVAQDVSVVAEEAGAPRGEPWPEFATAVAERIGGEREILAWRRLDMDCRTARQISRRGAPEDPPWAGGRGMGCEVTRVRLALSLKDGTPLRLELVTPPRFRPPPHLPSWRLLLLVALIALLGWFVVRKATQPLRLLAKAAEELGADIRRAPLDEKGPREVRSAARALNNMQTQILRYVAERTQMLAAIAHDLKTPLTRLRLRLERLSDEGLRDQLVADVRQMQELIDQGLQLAHSLDDTTSFVDVDLGSLIESACADAADAGADVGFERAKAEGQTAGVESRVLVKGRPDALRRAFQNVLDNAVKYGGRARVRLETSVGKPIARVIVSDDGPGIPEDQLQQVLKPFQRLEGSRSRETGGTGLGLTIAANIIRTHRGRIELSNRTGGGLAVSLELPMA